MTNTKNLGLEHLSATEFIAAISGNIDSINNGILPLQYLEQEEAWNHIMTGLGNQQHLLPEHLNSIYEDVQEINNAYKECKKTENDPIKYKEQCLKLLEQLLSEIEVQKHNMEKLKALENNKEEYEQQIQKFINEAFKQEERIIRTRVATEYDREHKIVYYNEKTHFSSEQKKAYADRDKILKKNFEKEKQKWENNEKYKYEHSLKLFNNSLQLRNAQNQLEIDNLVQEKKKLISDYTKKLQN